MGESITQSYHIGGMSCGGCVFAVKQKLSTVPGVISVMVNLATKQAGITSSEEIKIEILRNAFSNTHYTISELIDKIS